jgi:hypothetical protein
VVADDSELDRHGSANRTSVPETPTRRSGVGLTLVSRPL